LNNMQKVMRQILKGWELGKSEVTFLVINAESKIDEAKAAVVLLHSTSIFILIIKKNGKKADWAQCRIKTF